MSKLIEGGMFKAIIPLPSSFTPEVNDRVNKGVNEVVNKGVNEVVNDTVPTNERAVLAALKENNEDSFRQIAEKLSLSKKTVAKHAKSLKEKGIIIRHGSRRKGYWEIQD
jgi:ATP-dependent DNA helicase RecG